MLGFDIGEVGYVAACAFSEDDPAAVRPLYRFVVE
jgi:hypothetical protein